MGRNIKAANVTVSAVDTCVSAILPCLTGAASDQQAAAKVTGTRNAAIVAAIVVLHAASEDASTYLSAVVEVFGNGLKSNADNIPGKLGDALKAHCTKIGLKLATAYTVLMYARKVANGFHREDVRKAATDKGLMAAYKLVKEKSTRTNGKGNGDSEQTNAVELTPQEWITAHQSETLTILVACFARAKDAIALERMHALETHLNGKTRKVG